LLFIFSFKKNKKNKKLLDITKQTIIENLNYVNNAGKEEKFEKTNENKVYDDKIVTTCNNDDNDDDKLVCIVDNK
jgi:hypothetical protein